MLALYRTLLRLYPAGYRHEYGEEMVTVFRQARTNARTSNRAAYAIFCGREFAGLLRGALLERMQRLTGSDCLSLLPLRRFDMRTEFRFPRSTVVLMTIILVGVIFTIDKAEKVAAALPGPDPYLSPVPPGHHSLLQPFVIPLAAVYVVAALVWAVLFALRRSGLHRLSALGTGPQQG